MKKWILILLLMYSILAQDEYSQQMQQFLENVKNDNIKESLLYLENISKKNEEEIEFAMSTIFQYKETFFRNKNSLLSQVLCSNILEILEQKNIENDLQIMLLNVLSMLDSNVILSIQEKIISLINYDINFACNFFNYFILKREPYFNKIALIVIKNEEIPCEIVQKVFFKYGTKSFWKDTIEILQQYPEQINFQIVFGLRYCLDEDFVTTLNIIIGLLNENKIKNINPNTKSYIIDIFYEGIEMFISTHKDTLSKDLNLFINIFKIHQDNILSDDVINLSFDVFYHLHEKLFTEQNLHEASVRIFPVILEKAKSGKVSFFGIQLILFLDTRVLINFKSELENIFSKNVETLSPCLAKLILKEEKFIDFYPILLNSPHNYNLYYTVFLDIYEKYGEKLFPYCEQGLKGSKLTKKRVIYSALYSQNQGNEFLTRYFVEIFHNLHLFHHTHPPTNELRELIKKVGVENILDLIISDKINTYYYSFHRDYEEEIVTALKNVLRDDNFKLSNHPYLENLSKSRFGIRKGIIEDKNINLRRNLLQIIYESKVDEYDAIITVLKYLSDPELEEKAKNIVTRFSRKKIHNALDIRGRSEYCDFNEEEVNLINGMCQQFCYIFF